MLLRKSVFKRHQWRILFTVNLAVGIFFLLSLFQKVTQEIPEQIQKMSQNASNPLYPELPSGDPSELESVGIKEPAICRNFYKVVCSKRGVTRDPTGTVRPDAEGEIYALRTYEEIIHQHPDWTSDQVDEALVKIIYTPKARHRIHTAFTWVLQHMERFIENQPELNFKSNEKRLLLERLRHTELQLPPPASIYADEPDLFSKNDVYYERTHQGDLRLRVGGAYVVTAKSWFNLVFTLSHELAHAIDPCEIKNANLEFSAYGRLTRCYERKKWILPSHSRSECGKNDHLSETFSDWFAVELTYEALKQFSHEFKGPQLVSAIINAVRDLCEQDEQLIGAESEQHPTPKLRIETLLGKHPGIREILGCRTTRVLARESKDLEDQYCRFDTAETPLHLPERNYRSLLGTQ